MSQEQSKTYQKLLRAHDVLYEAAELLGNVKAPSQIAPDLSKALDMLDEVEALLDSANGSNIWKGKD